MRRHRSPVAGTGVRDDADSQRAHSAARCGRAAVPRRPGAIRDRIFEGAAQYAVNVLAHDQVELARRFSHPHTDRFAGVPFRLGQADAPLIEGCAAWLECRHHALHPAGDHMLFIGEVVAAAHRRLSPLVWHGSRYRVSQPGPEGRDD
ncbi:MAG: flavin reductase family protein [Betaproteobacteria bacterium]|nr:MAG: flavin reductase family protein [Betaproteobacteria bacterium]